MCLETSVGQLKMKNPLMLASGILDMTKESMEKFRDAGAVVTKSVGMHEREGYKNPSVVEIEYGLLNAMGLPNPGIECYLNEIDDIRMDNIIGSIFGKDENEFSTVAKKMEGKVKAIEMNMSCPHAGSYGTDFPMDLISGAVEAVKKSVTVPVFVKLGTENIIERAEEAAKGGADAIVAINTVKAMAIDVETAMPILANKVGGYSGPAIKPVGVRCVYELATKINIPIVGVGGIITGRDVLEYMMAGASAVQIGSGIYYQGEKIFGEIRSELKEWLKLHGYSRIKDIVGIAIGK
ncbi:MAG: dihydroorotate dehydrogenase [Candidatus Thermoplasmatota archaeon]|nr:dihydroorotate dehydrogenase [Candidatus Thermoplasmatota archaeon]